MIMLGCQVQGDGTEQLGDAMHVSMQSPHQHAYLS